MRKLNTVSLSQLNRALAVVQNELDNHGLWTERIAAVDVYLETFHANALTAYGWHVENGNKGWISIPSVSLPRLANAMGFGRYMALRDVLRHEYAHAIAHLYSGLLRRLRFARVFGRKYDSKVASRFVPQQHVTPYAATEPAEDFADTYMTYLRHAGRLPARYDWPVIRKKWRFVGRLCGEIRRSSRS